MRLGTFLAVLGVAVYAGSRQRKNRGVSYWLGRPMTQRLRRLIVPQLRWNQEIYGQTLGNYIGPETNWLDVGCGHRVLPASLEALEDRLILRARQVVGCDVDEEAIKKHRSIRAVQFGSASSLPFENQSFDLVTANMVFEHLADPDAAFVEITRVLTPGGRLIILTPNLWNYLVLGNHVASKLLPRRLRLRLVSFAESRKEEDIYPTVYRANTVKRLSRLATQAGLHVKQVRMLTSPQPFFKFFAPVAFFQLLLMRLTLGRTFRRFSETILMVFERPALAATNLAEDATTRVHRAPVG